MKKSLLILKESFIKKQLLLIAIILGASFTEVSAQAGFDYRTFKTGGFWSSTSTWERTPSGTNNWTPVTTLQAVPNETAGSITILSGATVTVSNSVVVDELTVANGGTLAINFPIVMTVTDGPGTDLVVNGTVLAKGRGGDGLGNIVTNGASASIEFSSTSVYKHNYEMNPANNNKTAWGIIPIASWDPASTVEINIAGTTMTTNLIPASANFNQSFGNLKWNTPALIGGPNISMEGRLTNIQGNFEVTSTGTAQLVLTNSASSTYNLTIGQDLKILNDSRVVFAAGNTTTPVSAFNLNIGRSLEVGSSAQFSHSRASFPINVTFTGTGTINVPNVLGNMNFEIAPAANMTLLTNFAIPGSQTVPSTINVYGTLNTGTYNLHGHGTFNLMSGSSLGIGAATGLATNGSIQVLNKNFSADATYIYNGLNFQTTGSLLPASISGLVIENTNNVELTNAVTITKTLSLQNGVLNTLGKTLKLIESVDLAVVKNTANNSYVDGAVTYEVASSGAKSMLFPIGKNDIYRPVTLNLTQGAGATNTYVATQVETALNIASGNYPADVDAVSNKRHYTITQAGAATVANAFVTLAFSADEVVSNTEMRIIKSSNTGWMNLGGTPEGSNSVESTIPFTTFSQFAIAYKNISPLPVELISFKAVKAENAVNVLWATASEKNNAYFAVERSADGKNFAAIGQVEGAGTTSATKNYAFLDKNPLNNVSYYRLKQVDLDGTFEYSEIVKVMTTNRNAALSLTAFPNPTTDKVNVQIAGLNEAATLQVMDMTGRVVANQEIAKNAAQAEVNLSNVPAGIYSVKLVTTEGTSVLKVIKK